MSDEDCPNLGIALNASSALCVASYKATCALGGSFTKEREESYTG